MLDYYNDITMRFQHTAVSNKEQFDYEAIGTHAYTEIDEVDYTDSDSNSIYVSDTSGNDTTGDGTSSTPYKTLVKGANSCTSTKTKVVVLDSALYAEDFTSINNDYFAGFYADGSQTPTYSLRTLNFTPSDSNSLYVDKTGNDSTGDGTAANPYLTVNEAIDNVDATHTAVVINDSGTYEEAGFEFTGNFQKLVAAEGCAPTISFNSSLSYISTETEIPEGEFVSSLTDYCRIIELNNGTIAIFYVLSDKIYVVVYNSSMSSIVTSASEIVSTNTSGIGILKRDDGNVSVFYTNVDDSAKGYYIELDTTCENIVESATKFLDSTCVQPGVCYNSSGDIFIAYRDSSSDGSYVVLDGDDYSVVTSAAQFRTANTTDRLSCSLLDSGNIFICFRDYVAGTDTIDFIELNGSTYAVETAETTIHSGDSEDGYAIKLQDGNIFVLYNDAGDSDHLKFVILDGGDFSVLISDTVFVSDESCTRIGCAELSNSTVLCVYGKSGSSNGSYKGLSIDADFIKISTGSYVSGILLTINNINSRFCGKFINGNSAALEIANCEIYGHAASDDSAYAIYTDDDLNIYNCLIHDGDKGIYAECNDFDADRNAIYRCDQGYAIHVKSTDTGPTIDITNNTLFQNYGGIYLDDNTGTNTIKNNIIYNNDVYGINAETGITQTYSINTDTNSGVTNGSSVLNYNPLFVNEGLIDEDDTDLHIKKTDLGDPISSPALGLDDNGDDAGAYNAGVIGEVASWTSFTVEKPAKGIKVWKEPVKAVRNILSDGTVVTYTSGWTEYLEIKWVGLRNADYDNIEAMCMSSDNQVRIYPDYTTNPNSYNAYTLIYDTINASPEGHYKLSRTGVSDVAVRFARKYERI